MKQHTQSGFIAISSLLVISAVLLAIGISVSLSAIAELQMTHLTNQSDSTRELLESCIEEALLSISETDSLNSSIILPQGTCTITLNSHSGSNWDFTASVTAYNNTKTITVTLTRSSTITITSWKEN